MIIVLILFAVGIILGRILQNRHSISRPLSVISYVAILALLFFLGLSISSNPEVLVRLTDIGLISFCIAISSVAGSILFVKIFVKTKA